jgi:hypothetical protein
VVAANTLSNAALVEAADEAKALNEDGSRDDKHWWAVSYRVLNVNGDTDGEETVEIIADDEENARYLAGLGDAARDVTDGQTFVIDSARKI